MTEGTGNRIILTKSDLTQETKSTIVFPLTHLARQQSWVDPLNSGDPKYLWVHRHADILISRTILSGLTRISLFLTKAARTFDAEKVKVLLDGERCDTKITKRDTEILMHIELKDQAAGARSSLTAARLEIDFGVDDTPKAVFGSSMLRERRFAAQIRKVGANLAKPFDQLEISGAIRTVEVAASDALPGLMLDALPGLMPDAIPGLQAPRIMVFTLGQGGYDQAFARAVESQRAYSARHGYAFTCISEPGDPSLGRENIWLKVLAFYGALLENDYVLYADTDVAISEACPPLTEAVSAAEPIGLVAGHSGRVNAGVIIAKRTPASLAFFAEWVKSLGVPLTARHDVGWGENGHLIRLAVEHRLKLLDTRWNNTFRPELEDYLRHYTGPMRRFYDFDETEQVAWKAIADGVEGAKALEDVDPISSFARLGAVYARTVPAKGFAPFDGQWGRTPAQAILAKPAGLFYEAQLLREAYVAEPIEDDSPNAYVLTLRNGLHRLLGRDAVTTGTERFWEGRFQRGEVVHIEWIESLFGWKIPDEDRLARFEARMAEIARQAPILYTAHNFDLMPTYGEARQRMLQAVADHATMICHLSPANVEPYNRHHAAIPGLAGLATAVVPHGDYQPYFTPGGETFEDPALKTDKTKILVFGHIRTAGELDFCLQTNELLDQDAFQMIFAGTIHPEILHWKKVHAFRDNWDGGPRRLHFKVPNAQVRSLVSQCDGLLVPRFDRLNSGVQFLAYSMLKPAFVPLQNSMMAVGARFGGGELYQPHDPASASAAIRRTFAGSFADRQALAFRYNAFNYKTQDTVAVARAHYRAYERALSLHQTRA